MKSETTIKQEISNMRNKSFKEIEAILRKFDYDSQDMISSFVASLCDVDIADMLSVTHNTQIAQARWLYWYTIRYFTHDTYKTISERTRLDGHSFTPENVGVCISKMSSLIETDDAWKRRWLLTKRMVRLLYDPHDYALSDFAYNSQRYKLMLQVPKGMKGNIEIEITEEK